MFRTTFVLFLLTSLNTFAAPDDPVSAARERQEKFKTVLLEYRQVSRMDKPETANRVAHELSASAVNKVVIQDQKIRVEDNNPTMSSGQGFFRMNRIAVFDGAALHEIYPNAMSAGEPPLAVRQLKSAKPEVYRNLPVTMFFRGLQPVAHEAGFAEIKPTGQTEVIDGSACVVWEYRNGEFVSRYSFDPAKSFALVRVQSKNSLTTISYRKDDTWGWLPTGWKSHQTPEGKTAYHFECEITNLVINALVADDQFKVVYPPGSNVHDEDSKADFIVEADGSLRERTLAEMFGPSQGSASRPWRQSHLWLSLTGLSVFLLLATTLAIRRRHRLATPRA